MSEELKQREREFEAEAARINAGRKPKFGDLMRNPWASESNPRRDAYFVRRRGDHYEFTDKRGEFWESRAKFAFFIDAEPSPSTAREVDVEAERKQCKAAFGPSWTVHSAVDRANLLAGWLKARGITPSAAAGPACEVGAEVLQQMERAAEYLEHYARYLQEVKLEDIERHPYIPSIEEAATELRTMAATVKAELASRCRGGDN
jgi:hypothetical protein